MALNVMMGTRKYFGFQRLLFGEKMERKMEKEKARIKFYHAICYIDI